MTWHVDETLRLAYLEDMLDGVSAASVEQHLVTCAACRGQLAVAYPVPAPDLDRVWLEIIDRVEAPPPTAVERAAVRLGLSEADARLLAIAPSLRGSWLAGVAVACALALWAAWFGAEGSVVLFLVVAPLAPVAGVAWAYGPAADPAYEVTVATPYPSMRLLLLRAAAVLLTSLPIVAVSAALLPVGSWIAVGWLLPSLSFVLAALALAAWVPITTSASVMGFVWSGLVVISTASHGTGAVVAAQVQPVYLVVTLIAAAALILRARAAP